MSQICKTNLVIKALNKLSEQDYVASAIIFYNKQLDSMVKQIKSGKLDKEALQKLVNPYNYLSKIYKETLKKDYDKVTDKSNYNELTSLYILNNFMRLCPSKMLLPYYERLSFLRKKLEKQFGLDMQLGIMLRSSLILDKLFKLQNQDAIEKFVSLLEKSRGSGSNLLYIIYYGLFDGTINNKPVFDTSEVVNNENISWELLNNNQNLPDSIVTELCLDNQFKDVSPDIILFIMNLFFMFKMFPKLPDDDMLDIIQKIFNNNVRDFDSKAEFLDLHELIKKTEQSFLTSHPKFGFEEYFIEIVNGIETLDRKDESESYGTI